MRRMSAGMPGAVCPGLFAEKVIEWLYWDIPQFGVLGSRTLLARAEALSCYANVASRFLVLTRTPCVQPWLASSSHLGGCTRLAERTPMGPFATNHSLLSQCVPTRRMRPCGCRLPVAGCRLA